MLRFLVKVVLMAGVFYLAVYAYDNILGLTGVEVVPNPQGALGEPGTWLWIALVFAVVNAIVGSVLRLLSLPFILLTLGLFLLVVNAAVLGITAALSDRLQVDGFGAAVVLGLMLAIGGWFVDLVVERR
ncbi:phage holin family protein [Geodermatophilus sp. SYSU D01186]